MATFFEIEAIDEARTVILLDIADYVHVDNSADVSERSSFFGRVRSRLFSYIRMPNDVDCGLNVVVEEPDDD